MSNEEKLLADQMRRRLEADFERILLGGWPRGYIPGKGYPGTLTVEEIMPSRCDKVVGEVTL